MHDAMTLQRPTGQVILRRNGLVELTQPNLVVDSAFEAMMRSLTGIDTIASVVFANTGGMPVSPGLRSVINPVAVANIGQAAETKPFLTKDSAGRKSIGTWTALLQPSVDLTYDMLGLTTTTGLLFAATAFEARTATAGDDLAVQWTISL